MKAVTWAGYCAAAGGDCTRWGPGAPAVPAEQTDSGQSALLRVTCWMLPQGFWFCAHRKESPEHWRGIAWLRFFPSVFKISFCLLWVNPNLHLSLLLQDSLPEKLAVHEKNVKEFDAFVETLQWSCFPVLLQQFFLLKASWRWHQQTSLSPLLCLLFTLTSSFHQVSVLCSLQQQIQLICWFSSTFPPHSSGPLFLLLVIFKTSVGTQEVKLQCTETYFLLSLCSVWRGFVKSCHIVSSKGPMVYVP